METMNYNRDNKKGSKAGIISFALFTVIGVSAVAYMIKNEPEPVILGQDMYVPVSSQNVDDDKEVNVYSEKDINSIKYKIKKDSQVVSKGKFKSNISVPQITVDGDKLEEINKQILDKFISRYKTVKKEVTDLEHSFTYKVTYNKYESKIENNRILTFTFYERIIDDSSYKDVTYKLYAYNIDLVQRKILSQDEAALIILGSTYKKIIKDNIKSYVIGKKICKESKYNYSLTGFEEFYVKDNLLHVMFNPGEMGNNKDYLDITIK